jgi:hypothetical protein
MSAAGEMLSFVVVVVVLLLVTVSVHSILPWGCFAVEGTSVSLKDNKRR